MTLAQIVLLVIGLLLFLISFIIPQKKSKMNDEEHKLGEKLIKDMVQQELATVQVRMEDVLEESVHFSVEKTERALDRLANEKIMAINEYSDTVLKEIDRNHEEVVFLYDMLNEKQKALKNTALEVQETVKTVEKKAEAVKGVVATVEEKTFTPLKPVKVEADKVKTLKKPTPKKEETQEENKEALPIIFPKGVKGGKNNNEKILKLHQMGKSNMAIAKELSLGVGEVKLVIDLFKEI